jgi:hypothetical protein
MTLSLSIVSCRASDPVQQCPAAFTQNDDRASRLWERLGAASAGAALMARGASKPRLCFGRTEISTITTNGILYFDDKLDESEGAARLGHLFMHFVDGMPMSNPRPTDCEAQVDEALRAESAALSLELQLRRELAVTSKRIMYQFEAPYWAAAPEERERLVLDYLRAHPDGAPGIDALAAGYAKRCRKAINP